MLALVGAVSDRPLNDRSKLFFYALAGIELIIIDRRAGAAGLRRAAIRRRSATIAGPGCDDAGADVGFDLHDGFLSCFALDCAIFG